MRAVECASEPEVMMAVLQSRWPERADAALREHVKTCAVCSDVAAVAKAIGEAHGETMAGAALPEAGLVWWKAQMRARREAMAAAGRPITAVQVAALAFAVGLMGACIGATSSWFQEALKGAWAEAAEFDPGTLLPYAAGLIEGHGLLAACLAAMIVLAPVAVYLAIGKD